MKLTTSPTVFMLTLLLSLGACVSSPRTTSTIVENSAECVVLLHGLNRSSRAMQGMADALHKAGFSTANVDYPSQSGPIEELAPLAVDTGLASCRNSGASRIHFVTHSIGGIFVRFAQFHSPIPELGRVVMLAPPNQGSEVIDITREWPAVRMFAGEAGLQLGTDAQSLPAKLGPVNFELGVIAGTGTINPVFSAMLPDDDDGKVTVARTKVPGMNDFLVVRNSHHYIMTSHIVIENTKSFLRTGTFVGSHIWTQVSQ